MLQYNFADSVQSVFNPGTRPQLAYLQLVEPEENMSISKALHSHQNILEISLIDSGTFRYMIDHQIYTVHAGDLMILNSNLLHASVMDGNERFSMCTLGIKNLQMPQKSPGILLDKNINPILPTGDFLPIIAQYFKILRNLIKEPKRETISEPANLVVASLLAFIQNVVIAKGTAKTKAQEYNLGLKIKEYIDAHYREDLKLADIAEAMHINPYYLSHTFKKLLGYSPIQYMIHRRIGEAQNMLINTNMTITEIALHCGYNNSNYFQVVFNSTVGMPPGKYRKSWRT